MARPRRELPSGLRARESQREAHPAADSAAAAKEDLVSRRRQVAERQAYFHWRRAEPPRWEKPSADADPREFDPAWGPAELVWPESEYRVEPSEASTAGQMIMADAKAPNASERAEFPRELREPEREPQRWQQVRAWPRQAHGELQ